jgi:hypothetical protein
VQEIVSHSQRAQARSRAARERIDINQRFGFSPKEFGEANGKSATWAYRQIYAGRIKPISDCGRLIIPRSEVEQFLSRAAEYNPKPKPKAESTPPNEQAGQPS